jgi:3-oxoacyl-[acyl-carrier-protein] synthase III
LKSRFESFGLYLPEKEVTTAELMTILEKRQNIAIEFEKIFGIRARRWRSDKETSYSIAMNAARDCLKNSRYQARDLDIIINTSITRTLQPATYYMDPALSVFIKKELGAHAARNFDISNACAGMMTGAYLLDGMIRAGVVKNGMVVSGEAITPIAETALREIKDTFDDQLCSLTVGDAGSAFILDSTDNSDEGIDFIELMTVADYAHLCIGSPSLISGDPCMLTKPKEMHDALHFGTIFLDCNLKKYNIDLSKYSYVITHQTSESMVKLYLKEFGAISGLKHLPTLMSVHDYGNTASTSLFLIVYNGLKQKKIKKGDRILLVSLASGIAFGHLSFTMGDLEV